MLKTCNICDGKAHQITKVTLDALIYYICNICLFLTQSQKLLWPVLKGFVFEFPFFELPYTHNAHKYIYLYIIKW